MFIASLECKVANLDGKGATEENNPFWKCQDKAAAAARDISRLLGQSIRISIPRK
jgi:hypothetical protein